EKGAALLSGFKKKVAKKDYHKLIESGKIMGALARHKVKAGDAFFIPAGRVHAIGKGIVLAEVQQTSDTTYRIFDYNRPGEDGKPRPLHTRLAKDAINFKPEKNYKIKYAPKTNAPAQIIKNKFFNVGVIALSKTLRRDLRAKDSFAIYMCVQGAARLEAGGGKIKLLKGDSVLVPAEIADITLSAKSAKLLEVYR
ncbi:MAG: class I mannose-6-phosphate isomerase, partial [Elusimicrobiota bacterium]|nr:class I mannose-6-phosphate isomerase [Elusimicrobiota bacterium]